MKVSIFAEIEAEFVARAHDTVWCNVTTMDAHNRPRSRILHPIWEGAEGWVFTRRNSLKARHLADNPYVSMAYIADVIRPVYADCIAEWVDNIDDKRRIWELFRTTAPPLGYDFSNIFTGADDPECGLLKFTPWRIELADMLNRDNRRVWLSR